MRLMLLAIVVVSLAALTEVHAQGLRGTLVYAGTISYVDVTNRVITVDGHDRFRSRTGVLMAANPGSVALNRRYENSASVPSYALASGARDFALPMLCQIISYLEKDSKKMKIEELVPGLPVEVEYLKSTGEGWRATAITVRAPVLDPNAPKPEQK